MLAGSQMGRHHQPLTDLVVDATEALMLSTLLATGVVLVTLAVVTTVESPATGRRNCRRPLLYAS